MCLSSTQVVSTDSIAPTIRSTVSGLRPSLKLGTHSTMLVMVLLSSVGLGFLYFVLCTWYFVLSKTVFKVQSLKHKPQVQRTKYQVPSTKTKVLNSKYQDRSTTDNDNQLYSSAVPTDRFINQRKNAWQRLEELLALLDRASLRRLQREEVRELGRIYRRTASDLAIARAESRDPRLVNYLNSLVIRAHGRIYRADSRGGQRVKQFFTHDFPQTFRSTWRYTAIAFSVFML